MDVIIIFNVCGGFFILLFLVLGNLHCCLVAGSFG